MRSLKLLFACLFTSFVAIVDLPVRAQLTPDETLGNESSKVTSSIDGTGNPFDLIEGGAARGGNLFHSFSDFNIGSAEEVYFSSPEGIETILSRVTGGSLSTIDGVLGTRGASDAALILMNPNGIVFGEGAVLETQGAFTATTATSVQLGDDGSFNAVSSESDNLLSVNPSALFFNGLASATPEILVKSRLGLSVLEGETLSLSGGDIIFDGGRVAASGSRVELSAVDAAGAIAITEEGSVLSAEAQRGDVRLENASSIDVMGSELAISAKNIQVLSDTDVFAGSQAERDGIESRASLISLEATEQIQIAGSGTFVGNAVGTGVFEEGGDIVLSAKNIKVFDGGVVATLALDGSNSGDIVITASDTVLLGSAGSNITSLFTTTRDNSKGSGGDIEIFADNFEMAGEIDLVTATYGSGDAGSINIEASGSSIFGGARGSGSQFITTFTDENSTGKGGDVTITSSDIEISNGTRITTATSSEAAAGDIAIAASDNLTIIGFTSGEERFATKVGSITNGRTGQAGNIEISATNLDVNKGGAIDSSTLGDGDAGTVRIDVVETARFDGARSASDGLFASGVRSNGSIDGNGRGGRIEIFANDLEVTNGAQILAASVGIGDAGDISVDVVDTVRLEGVNPFDGGFPSGIGSDVLRDGSGRGGSVSVSAADIELTNGASIGASVFGRGDAGNVMLNASDTVRVDGVNLATGRSPTSISSTVEPSGEGQGGIVEIVAADLVVTNGGFISTSVLGRGDAGNVLIDVSDTVVVDGVSPIMGNAASGISSGINGGAEGRGGSVIISAAALSVTNGGQIDTSVFGRGDAGNVEIDVLGDVLVSGFNQLRSDDVFPSTIASSVNDGGVGRGGGVRISADSLEVSNKADIAAFSEGEGAAGSIDLDIDDRILVEGDSNIATLSTSGSGGQVDIQADGVVLRDDGNIRTSVTSREGTGGRIIIDADYIVALGDSDVLSFSRDGRGGDIDLRQTALFSESFVPIDESLSRDELLELNRNNRADINATGGITSGQILITEANFVENNLVELPDSLVDIEALVANACVVRSADADGTLVLGAGDRSRQAPSSPLLNTYPTSAIQSLPLAESEVIQEPQALYQLPDGRLLMSHRCE